MSAWRDYRRAMLAESLKARRTLALWLVSVLPAAPAGLQLLLQANGTHTPPSHVDAWLWLGYGVTLIWAMVVLPLFIALETGLLAGIEHGANGWKHLFVLPVGRGSVYAAKVTTAVGLVAAAHVMLAFWTVVAGEILGAVRQDLSLTRIPSAGLMLFFFASLVGSFLMVSIHAWVGLRWPSLVLNAGIAVTALVVNLSLVDSDLRRFFPWFIPMELTNRIVERLVEQAAPRIPGDAVPALMTSVLGGIVVGLAAIVTLSRRDVQGT